MHDAIIHTTTIHVHNIFFFAPYLCFCFFIRWERTLYGAFFFLLTCIIFLHHLLFIMYCFIFFFVGHTYYFLLYRFSFFIKFMSSLSLNWVTLHLFLCHLAFYFVICLHEKGCKMEEKWWKQKGHTSYFV